MSDKLAEAIYDLNPDVQPWNGDPFSFGDDRPLARHKRDLALRQAAAIAAIVRERAKAELDYYLRQASYVEPQVVADQIVDRILGGES